MRAPITGRIGDRRVSPGNLVTGGIAGNTTLLATIVSTDPIRFEFTFDEASFLRYERAAKLIVRRGAGTARVALKLIDEKEFTHKGQMDFVDNVIDRSSGTIRGRARFPMRKALFTPGMFARVRVPGSPPYEALLVPDLAIGTEQGRKFVSWSRPTTPRAEIRDARQCHRRQSARHQGGPAADDRVIVNGLMRARAGQKVTPQEQGRSAASAPQAKTQ